MALNVGGMASGYYDPENTESIAIFGLIINLPAIYFNENGNATNHVLALRLTEKR